MILKNKTNIFIIFLIMILVIVGIITILVLHNRETLRDVSFKNNNESQDDENSNDNIINKSIEISEVIPEEDKLPEEKKEQISEIKTNLGITGNSELYEIQNNNNIEIPVIKASVKYKVAFSGMIKNKKPEINEIDNIIKENHPKYAGIWIDSNSREKFLELVKNNTKSTYVIDENGYLKIKNKNQQNENDKKIENIINGNKLYIFSISSTCYIVDDVTGEILDYCFENLDRYQTYEYFNDDDKYVIFVTENKNNLLKENEIFESLVRLISL